MTNQTVNRVVVAVIAYMLLAPTLNMAGAYLAYRVFTGLGLI